MLMERLEPGLSAGGDAAPSRYKTGYGQEGYIITPPWSTITAYDLNTGKIMWQTPYGDTPQAGPSDKLRGNVYAEERVRRDGRAGWCCLPDNQVEALRAG